MKKKWISVKCGLSRDPKHRQAMGESIWLFLHLLDVADWESGIVREWKDEAGAEEMSMQVRTLREHRRKLDELGYITCQQKQYGQDIIIHNWTNPREYSGEVYNARQGDTKTTPQENQGDTQGYIQGDRKDATPTFNPKNQIPTEKKIQLPQGSDIGFMLAVGMKSEDIADVNAKDEAERALLFFYESKMGYGTTLDWWGKNADLVALRKFLVMQKAEDIETFAKWCDRKYSKFTPEDAARYPRQVMIFWPRAFGKESETVHTQDRSVNHL